MFPERMNRHVSVFIGHGDTVRQGTQCSRCAVPNDRNGVIPNMLLDIIALIVTGIDRILGRCRRIVRFVGIATREKRCK